jgi:GMP synthase-like glutamine amidotransferase
MTVTILQFVQPEGPAYLGDYLGRAGVTTRVVELFADAAVPELAAVGDGLVLMGGPMSANDPLPWIPPVLALLQAAAVADLPMLGHCLGAQLLARALGGEVTANPAKEIGWGAVTPVGEDGADWFGTDQAFTAFHWHGETFSLPPGATHILRSDACENQGFVRGKTLGLQCHVEMTARLIADWCRLNPDELAAADAVATVQAADQMLADVDAQVALLQQMADRVYARFLDSARS